MELSKKSATPIILAFGVMAALYNALVLLLPFPAGGGFWVGYGFTMAAFPAAAGATVHSLGKSGLRSKFYGLPFAMASWYYLVAQLAAGLLEMGLSGIVSFRYGIAVNLILLVAFLWGLIAIDVSAGEIGRIDEKAKEKTLFIKSLQIGAEGLAAKAVDDSAKGALKELADAIRFSDPMSSPQLAAAEGGIEDKFAILAESAEKGDGAAVKALCGELRRMLDERNRKCKLLK